MKALNEAIGVVDDDHTVRGAIAELLAAEGWETEVFVSAQDFLARNRRDAYACLILDVDMPGMTGLELHRRLTRSDPQVPVIFLTGHGDIPTSVEAIKAGACEFFSKPFRPGALIEAIHNAVQPAPRAGDPSASLLVGNSRVMREVQRKINLVAGTDATVLITGESGTGKELVARAIHERSARRQHRLVSVNCGAIPESLFESELFGHARGAFTGAIRDLPGRFELADGGTVFLDEIGELPLSMQAKLLRFLQEKEIDRVGDRRPRKLEVRIVAATNRDLDNEVAAGRFRSDLFYRLNVFPILSPPLRERRDDIPLLSQHFLQTYARKLKKPGLRIPTAAIQELAGHDWPGNIRELQNVIERAVIVSKGRHLQFELPTSTKQVDRSGPMAASNESPIFTRAQLKQREQESIVAALASCSGKVSGPEGAAVLLGMKPSTLYSRIAALGIQSRAKAPSPK